jgi:hypothetical protein
MHEIWSGPVYKVSLRSLPVGAEEHLKLTADTFQDLWLRALVQIVSE